MRMYYVSPTYCGPMDVTPSLQTYYDLLGCDLIDITERKIGGRYFDIIVDDEGLLKDSPRISAVTKSIEPALVGNLLICNHNAEGEETPLTDEEVKLIDKCVMHYSNIVVLD